MLSNLQCQGHSLFCVRIVELGSNMPMQAGDQSAGRVVWCIGGPFGHSQAVVDRADDVIRLSNLVLNHQVANIVLLEQIYRGAEPSGAHQLENNTPDDHQAPKIARMSQCAWLA